MRPYSEYFFVVSGLDQLNWVVVWVMTKFDAFLRRVLVWIRSGWSDQGGVRLRGPPVGRTLTKNGKKGEQA